MLIVPFFVNDDVAAYLDLGEAVGGTIATEIGLLSKLEYLNLEGGWGEDGYIAFNGTLPAEIGKLTNLSYLNLQKNSLSGTIPSEVWLLGSLMYMNLNSNTALGGAIPSDIGLLTSLTTLNLHSCSWGGSIPTEIGLLDNLRSLHLGNSLLNETLPTEIGLLTNLLALSLGGTKLSGTIPNEILQLPNLERIEFSGSLLTLDLTAADFSCDETIVELVVTTTNYWSNEITWEFTTEDGTVALLGGGGYFGQAPHHEKVCVPLDACSFTLFGLQSESIEITRLGKVYQIDPSWNEDSVAVNICA